MTQGTGTGEISIPLKGIARSDWDRVEATVKAMAQITSARIVPDGWLKATVNTKQLSGDKLVNHMKTVHGQVEKIIEHKQQQRAKQLATTTRA